MSVYIKGMEMPERCGTCKMHFLGDPDYVCCGITDRIPKVVAKYSNSRTDLDARKASIESVARPDWCPLVPVPEHGRLGDLDDVINDIHHYLCEGCSDYLGPDAKTESCDYCGGMMLIKTIERKTSIIPADKEEQT